jgi:3D (Asp-Asp-Asp) domain-containing protein
MTYGYGRQEKSQNIGTDPTVVFQTTKVAVQLKDSTGALMDTGTAQYYAGGWRDIGATSGGQVSKELLPASYTFSMTYGFARQEKSQNIATDPTVVFQTTRVIVQLKDSAGAMMDTGTAQYYAGGWRDIGATSGGQVSKELLPASYTFAMTYGFARQEKSQNIGTDPMVVFQTTRVMVQLKDSTGNFMDTGTVQYYAGGWRDIGATSGGQVIKELLPASYTFSMTYGYGRQEKSQNVTTNPTVVFQTGKVHSDSGRCTQYYAGGWRTFTQDMELLPVTYTFRFNDGTSNSSNTITSGTVNHIH